MVSSPLTDTASQAVGCLVAQLHLWASGNRVYSLRMVILVAISPRLCSQARCASPCVNSLYCNYCATLSHRQESIQLEASAKGVK